MAWCQLLLVSLLAALGMVTLASTAAARSTSHIVREVTARLAVPISDHEATTTELMEEYDDGPVGGGSAYELPSAEVDTLSSTSYETVAPTIRPTLSNASPPNHVTRPKTVTVPPVPITTTTMTTTTRRPPTLAPAPAARPKGSPLTTFLAEGPQSDDLACPRREDIHPCQCIEIPSRIPGDVETVATCKNIRNHQVLSDALKGFQHYRINFFVLDSCKLPPFPNGLFHNVNVEWMEVLNSTVQFQRNFFTCSKDCL